MQRFLRDNGLSLTLFALFIICIVGQAVTGWRAHLEDLRTHGGPLNGLLDYLTSGHLL